MGRFGASGLVGLGGGEQDREWQRRFLALEGLWVDSYAALDKIMAIIIFLPSSKH
jgi:hypothetical protein